MFIAADRKHNNLPNFNSYMADDRLVVGKAKA